MIITPAEIQNIHFHNIRFFKLYWIEFQPNPNSPYKIRGFRKALESFNVSSLLKRVGKRLMLMRNGLV